jgi:hypothetical protein
MHDPLPSHRFDGTVARGLAQRNYFNPNLLGRRKAVMILSHSADGTLSSSKTERHSRACMEIRSIM